MSNRADDLAGITDFLWVKKAKDETWGKSDFCLRAIRISDGNELVILYESALPTHWHHPLTNRFTLPVSYGSKTTAVA